MFKKAGFEECKLGSLDLHSPVKSSTRYRVSGGGLKRAHEKGSGGWGGLDCWVIDPFLTVESNKLTLINMIPKIQLSNPRSGLQEFKKWNSGDHLGNI